MRVVEFLGAPGSGKSTIADLLPAHLEEAASLPETVRSAIARHGSDRMTRVAARLTRSAESRLWNAAYARSTDRFAALTRFTAAHRDAIDAIVSMQRERAVRDLRPDLVLDWVLNLAARYQLATEGGESGLLVIDEGFAQRGVALLAGGFEESDLSLLAPYLGSMPRPDAVVMVDTPLDVCWNRLELGGWSQRLDGVDAVGRRRFLEATLSLSSRIASDLEESGARVIWVSGTTPVSDSVVLIAATLQC